MRGSHSAIVAAALTGILVGAAMVSTRAVSADASPATLAFLRYLIGLCVLAGPAWLGTRTPTRFARKDAAVLAALGVFQFAVLIVLLNHALGVLSATTCALVFSTMPLFTMLLAVLSGQEAFSLPKLTGLVCAVSGVAVLLHGAPLGGTAGVGGGTHLGAMAALIGATVIGAVCSLLVRPLLQCYPALPTSVLAMCAAVVFLLALCATTGQPLWPSLSSTQWGHVAFIGLSSGVGYFCWLWALTRLEASRVVGFQALGPVTAAVLELLVGRQWPSWSLLMSIALVVSGLLITQQGRRPSGSGARRQPGLLEEGADHAGPGRRPAP
ncbi:DMT family transporter [Cupriavidus sp. SIMBA_020]|uniref:DMT family transporter n=1 Tax=Cupriavidus sp. SIMBA_020 TaxID=3085766 RepID=UPI00397A50B0